MKIEWEAEDIKPGRVVGKPDRTERWLIGYIPGKAPQHYVLVSLSDGMVSSMCAGEGVIAERSLHSSDAAGKYRLSFSLRQHRRIK